MLFARFLRPLMKRGTLVIIDHTGARHVIGNGAPTVTAHFHDPKLGTRLFINPALYAGEAYMNGGLTVEGADIFALLDLIMANIGRVHGHWLARTLKSVERFGSLLKTYNPAARSRRNVAHHYDLSPFLYERFLDRDQQYSMAYFADPNEPLEIAQERKIDHIATKLLLKPGQHVLDIGCGWGGLAHRLNRRYGVQVTGISLSEEQLKVARARAAQAGVAKDVTFLMQDYRDTKGQFDRIVSVGMFEHVGLPHYGRFFSVMKRLLAPDGVALLHTIGRADGPGATDAWTDKYIFPGGYAPAMSEVVPHIERAGFYIADVEILRMHYAWTLHEWRRRFLAHRAEIAKVYDERFCRMWEFFLASAESGFRNAFHVNFQFQLCTRLDAVPFTRDYMYRSAAGV
jgi:cyclopropane-fatty-acyl-phospholipid synthase